MDIRHHPDDELLLARASGRLEIGAQLVLDSHLELCPHCRARLQPLQALGGALLEEEAQPHVAMAANALEQALARIDALEAQARVAPVRKVLKVSGPPPLPPGTNWPRALTHCTATRWRWMGPGMRWSRVSVPGSPEAKVFLLRIGAGKYLPQHTHIGMELTQVLYGRFHDGRALFAAGDFDATDAEIHHQPVVQDGHECICLAAVQGRLVFEGFIARQLASLIGM